MSEIVIREQGAVVRRRGERLVISKQGQTLDQFPLNKVDQLVLMGNVQVTAQAMATLLLNDIDVVYMSSHGTYRGGSSSGRGNKAQLRLQQYQHMSDPDTILQLAQAVVIGKIHNQRQLLQHLTTHTPFPNRRTQQQLHKASNSLPALQQSAATATSLDSLRGYEGRAAATYFGAWRLILDPAWQFKTREFYPPPDPFNALLSFTYSLLLKDVRAAVKRVGFDVGLGFFHQIAPGRPSLALDMMEEWRPLLADHFVWQLVSRRAIEPDDFVFTGRVRRPIELKENHLRLILQHYGNHLETPIHHPLAGGQTTLRQAIPLQARQLARVMRGQQATYQPIQQTP